MGSPKVSLPTLMTFRYNYKSIQVGKTKIFCVMINNKLVHSFCTIFLYVILGWYHNNLWWKYCLLFNQEKTFFGPKRSLINKLSWYYPKITYKNIVPKDMNKFIVLCNLCTTLYIWNFCYKADYFSEMKKSPWTADLIWIFFSPKITVKN